MLGRIILVLGIVMVVGVFTLKYFFSGADQKFEYGQAALMRGEYEQALDFFREALEKDLEKFGENHATIALDYASIGQVWEAKGEFDKAIDYYKKALDINLKNFGSEALQVADDYTSLGIAWVQKQDFDKAIEYFDKALVIIQSHDQPDPFNLAMIYHNLGQTLRKKAEKTKDTETYQKALEYYIKARDTLEKQKDKAVDVSAEIENINRSIQEIQEILKE